jgi:hypothetical protein
MANNTAHNEERLSEEVAQNPGMRAAVINKDLIPLVGLHLTPQKKTFLVDLMLIQQMSLHRSPSSR